MLMFTLVPLAGRAATVPAARVARPLRPVVDRRAVAWRVWGARERAVRSAAPGRSGALFFIPRLSPQNRRQSSRDTWLGEPVTNRARSATIKWEVSTSPPLRPRARPPRRPPAGKRRSIIKTPPALVPDAALRRPQGCRIERRFPFAAQRMSLPERELPSLDLLPQDEAVVDASE
jgi:hypothetical protein